MSSSNVLRVLHYPTDVGGNPSGLARAERELGLESTVAVWNRSWLGYEVDRDLALDQVGVFRKGARLLRFAWSAARAHDVFHFNFGRTLLPMFRGRGIDLPWLRSLGKTILVTFQGCDARQVSVCSERFEYSCCGRRSDPVCNPRDDAKKARRIEHVVRHAHRVFCLNPDLLHVVPGAEFLPYASVDPRAWRVVPPRDHGPITVLHAPTHRAVKGTRHIERAIERLRERFDVELLLVENVAHAEARELYRRADIVVDQLLVGFYGALAVEAMAMGKPVVCYLREADLELLPRAMREELPIVNARPDTIETRLAELCEEREQLVELGARSRRFAERWHDPVRIARRLAQIYADPSRSFWGESGTL